MSAHADDGRAVSAPVKRDDGLMGDETLIVGRTYARPR